MRSFLDLADLFKAGLGRDPRSICCYCCERNVYVALFVLLVCVCLICWGICVFSLVHFVTKTGPNTSLQMGRIEKTEALCL